MDSFNTFISRLNIPNIFGTEKHFTKENPLNFYLFIIQQIKQTNYHITWYLDNLLTIKYQESQELATIITKNLASIILQFSDLSLYSKLQPIIYNFDFLTKENIINSCNFYTQYQGSSFLHNVRHITTTYMDELKKHGEGLVSYFHYPNFLQYNVLHMHSMPYNQLSDDMLGTSLDTSTDRFILLDKLIVGDNGYRASIYYRIKISPGSKDILRLYGIVE